MKTIYILLVFISSSFFAGAQVEKAVHLETYALNGNALFKKNLAFGDYKTNKFRRSLGSWFSFQGFSPANLLVIEGVPLYKRDKRWSSDKFHFRLKKQGHTIANIEAHAVMIKNERFRLLGSQDSTFFGKANTDLLLGSVELANQPGEYWDLAAYNLNGTKEEPQKGVLKKGEREIHFERTVLLLNEEPGRGNNLFAAITMVYAFKYQNEIVGAVSFKDTDRRLWLKESLDEDIKTVIGSTATLLTFRRDIYK